MLLARALATLLAVSSAASAGDDEPPPQVALEAALGEAIAGSCPGASVSIDPELTRAARRFVQAVRAGRAEKSAAALDFFASLETSEPVPVAGIGTAEPPSRADRAVGDLFPKACRFNRAGVAATGLGAQALVAVLTAQHASQLDPIRPAARGLTSIGGALGPRLSAPRLYVLTPAGEVLEQPLLQQGARLSAQISLRDKGEYTVEVLADGAGGPQVAAMRRVFVGVPPPEAPPPQRDPARGEVGLGAVETAIARLRSAHGLPRLQRNPALDAIARGHSEEMARTRTFAHVLKSDGSPSDRLHKAGYAARSAGENIGLSADALSAHEAVESSPAHLANLLDPHHRRLGLGVASGASPEGTDGVYLTEVLAAPIVGEANPAAAVAKVLAEQRRKLGLPALLRDRLLDRVARHEVHAIALSGAPLAKTSAAQHALDEDDSLRSAVAEVLVGSAPDEVSSSKNLRDESWTRLGVGAIYASSATYGPGRLWVLMLFGR